MGTQEANTDSLKEAFLSSLFLLGREVSKPGKNFSDSYHRETFLPHPVLFRNEDCSNDQL